MLWKAGSKNPEEFMVRRKKIKFSEVENNSIKQTRWRRRRERSQRPLLGKAVCREKGMTHTYKKKIQKTNNSATKQPKTTLNRARWTENTKVNHTRSIGDQAMWIHRRERKDRKVL